MSSLEIKHFSSTKILRQTYPLSITHRNYSVFPYLTPPPSREIHSRQRCYMYIAGNKRPINARLCVSNDDIIFSVNQMASIVADLFLNDLTFC